MKFSLWKCAAVSVVIGVMLCCSCEEHHPGEIPSLRQTSHANETTTTPSVTPAASDTPADFFPASSPH